MENKIYTVNLYLDGKEDPGEHPIFHSDCGYQ